MFNRNWILHCLTVNDLVVSRKYGACYMYMRAEILKCSKGLNLNYKAIQIYFCAKLKESDLHVCAIEAFPK